MSSRLAIAYEDADDRSLVSRARAGNEEAFAVLVRRYRRELVAHARRLVAAADAEDVVQVALVRAYQALRDGAVPIRFGPWLHRIVRNAGLDLLRRRDARSAIDDVSPGAAPDPHEAYTQRERVRALTAAIRELPDGERQALVGHELEGHSHRELARAAGRSEVAIRQAAQRARARLRRAALGWAPAGWLVRLIELPGRAVDAAVPVSPAGRAAGCLAMLAAGAIAVGAADQPSSQPKPHATARAHAPHAVAPVRSRAMPAAVVARAQVAPVEPTRAADHRHHASLRSGPSSRPAAEQDPKGPGPAPPTSRGGSSSGGPGSSSGGGSGSSPGGSSGSGSGSSPGGSSGSGSGSSPGGSSGSGSSPGGSTPAPVAVPAASTSGGPGPSVATATTGSSGPGGPGGGGDDGSGGGPGPG